MVILVLVLINSKLAYTVFFLLENQGALLQITKPMVELQGFPSVGGGGDDPGAESETEMDTSKLVQEANRKKKKSGGFQSMGLSQEVWKGVIKKGYKVPTPIQRKTVPLIMDGKVL